MVKFPPATHEQEQISLRRIEGQVRGLQKMIEEKKYCMDIIFQVHAVINALHRVAENILSRHLEHCVSDAFRGRSERGKREKAEEIMDLIRRLHKL
ncbi:MAG: metal-sensitive transcriptional regulator [PVC group bacterium]